MRELFVYYRIAEADAARADVAVRAFQRQLMHDVPGLRARFLGRPEVSNGELTRMEVYAGPGGVDAALQSHIEGAAAALSPLLRSPRHVEVFIDLS